MELQELQLMNEEAKIKAGADLEYAEVEKSELDVRLASMTKATTKPCSCT